MGAGMSHWDLIMKSGCAQPDHGFAFDTPAGFSTSEAYPSDPNAMGWTGYFEPNGDPSLNPPNTPLIKYNDPHDPDGEAGAAGYGMFSFYANIIPEYGTYESALVAKAGTVDDTYGALTGAYPSCTIIPEPASAMLFLGGFSWLIRRRVRRH